MPHFRILHLSDLHFCVTPNRRNFKYLWQNRRDKTLQEIVTHDSCHLLPTSYDPEIAETVAKFVYEQPTGFYDLILCSGDLATTGEMLDLESAFQFTQSRAVNKFVNASNNPTILGDDNYVFLMPGNHDRYRDVRGNAGNATFDLMFEAVWGRNSTTFGEAILHDPNGSGDALAFIAVDFCLKENSHASWPVAVNRYGQGRAYQEIVDELIDRTQSIRERVPGVFVVWVSHFPPKLARKRSMSLLESDKVVSAARTAGVELILTGHLHEKVEAEVHNVHIWSAGSCSSIEVNGGNWLHAIEFELSEGQTNSIRKLDYKYVQSRQNFIQQGVVTL